MSSQSLLSRLWKQRAGSEDTPTSDDDSSLSSKSNKGTIGHSPSPYNTENGGGGSAERTIPSSYNGAPAGTRLAQEIHDEFLVCKICLEGYKNPKCLNCLHTFCEQCIENHINSEATYKKYSDYREFTCPLCRKRTQLPVGGVKKLPDNFLVSSLTEVVGRQRPSKYPFCDICKTVNKKQREATSKCLDCAKLLCMGCVELHRETKVTSGHSLFDVEIEKDIECKEHKDEVVRFYCEPCDACICVLCTFNEHKDHEITQFTDAVTKYKKTIQGLLDKCNDKISGFDSQVEALEKCEDIIKAVQQKVHDTAIQFIQDVRNKEKQMIEELENLYGAECMERIVNKKSTSTQVETLRSTCNLTQVILTGKDIELLLLKRDVQDKLNSLNSVSIKNLPSTISKVVEFVSGSVDFGYIHDHDRPLLSKMRNKRSVNSDSVDYYPPTVLKTSDTQTDPDITKLKVPDSKDTSSSSDDSSSSSSDDSDDDSDEDSDDSDDSDEAEKKTIEKEVQTDRGGEESIGTMTEAINLEEKGVNTMPLSSVSSDSADFHDSSEDLSDNSLAARRRRRRERAQMGGAPNGDGGSTYNGEPSPYSGVGGYQSRASGAYARTQHASMEEYYEAPVIGRHHLQRQL